MEPIDSRCAPVRSRQDEWPLVNAQEVLDDIATDQPRATYDQTLGFVGFATVCVHLAHSPRAILESPPDAPSDRAFLVGR